MTDLLDYHKNIMYCSPFETEVGLLNKSSCLAADLGVTKFDQIHNSCSYELGHTVVLLKSDLNAQQTGLSLALGLQLLLSSGIILI
jgi:hypothetical protein